MAHALGAARPCPIVWRTARDSRKHDVSVAEPLKNLIDPELVRACGSHLARVWRDFDRKAFEAHALPHLESLELKARAMRVADALEATLPDDFDRAAGIIEAALAPVTGGDALGVPTSAAGLGGWIGWPLGEFLARRGQATPERGLRALHALTQRFTAEFAIRPYLLNHFELTLRTLDVWCADPSARVRRLVSEGTRPRLPWALRIKRLIEDPSPALPLLRALQDDGSEVVRRSVANHLNDIAKDHPAVVAEWLEAHLPGASDERRALLRHASRTLVKKGDARVLQAWGFGRAFEGEAELALAPSRVVVGGHITLSVELRSTAAARQKLAIDYVVHHVKANGRTSPKVFKGWSLELEPREVRRLVKIHSFRPITTRVYYSGEHRIELLVNGSVAAGASFQLDA